MANPNAQKEALEQARHLIFAYKAVFGVEGNRSEAQKLVWEDMKARARVETPVFLADASGQLCPLRAANADGARMYFLQLSEIVRSTVEQPKEVEVKR
jgi:hypothetical protein